MYYLYSFFYSFLILVDLVLHILQGKTIYVQYVTQLQNVC